MAVQALEHLDPSEHDFAGRAAAAGLAVPPVLVSGDVVVDLSSYVVTVDGVDVDLSPRQLELLAVFLAAPGRVWSRHQLHWLCWGDHRVSRRVDVQLCRIRTRTGRDLFRNVRERGWVLRQLSAV